MTNSDTNILFMLMKVYLGSCHASSPTSVFKGHTIVFNAAPALCQVTWIFQLKSISVLSALCVSVLTDTPPEAWGHSVRRSSSVLSLWCLMNVEGNSRCCFSSPDDEVHWTFWVFFRLPNAQGPSCCCSLEKEFALWALRACEWLELKRNGFVAYMLHEVTLRKVHFSLILEHNLFLSLWHNSSKRLQSFK